MNGDHSRVYDISFHKSSAVSDNICDLNIADKHSIRMQDFA